MATSSDMSSDGRKTPPLSPAWRFCEPDAFAGVSGADSCVLFVAPSSPVDGWGEDCCAESAAVSAEVLNTRAPRHSHLSIDLHGVP